MPPIYWRQTRSLCRDNLQETQALSFGNFSFLEVKMATKRFTKVDSPELQQLIPCGGGNGCSGTECPYFKACDLGIKIPNDPSTHLVAVSSGRGPMLITFVPLGTIYGPPRRGFNYST